MSYNSTGNDGNVIILKTLRARGHVENSRTLADRRSRNRCQPILLRGRDLDRIFVPLVWIRGRGWRDERAIISVRIAAKEEKEKE